MMYEFGKNIGIAFQLKDDILDVYGNSEKFGKKIGTDIIANNAYADEEDQILFLDNSGQLLRLSETSDIVNVPLLSRTDSKHILCYPKWLFQDSDTKTLL